MTWDYEAASFRINEWRNPPEADYSFLWGGETAKVREFHRSMAGYEETPLVRLSSLARRWGLKEIFVKDESKRFDIESFKVLGGSYALCKVLGERLNLGEDDFKFDRIRDILKESTGNPPEFCTASDGNHGRGIAWTAQKLGLSAHVFLPKGTVEERVLAIERLGATALVTDLNYDDTVRLAEETAEDKGWVLVQDTSWTGYEKIPKWIMMGYTTMAAEAADQMEALGVEKPTHVFLQAGVGAMAAGVLGYLTGRYGEGVFKTLIVEPARAACYYKSAGINDGKPHAVEGDLATMMAGLSCGEPVTVGYGIIRDHADAFASCEDSVAALGMRILSSPLPGDERVVSGESGAVGLGLAGILFGDPEYGEAKALAGLDESSRILLFSTEGATDLDNYLEIVWKCN